MSTTLKTLQIPTQPVEIEGRTSTLRMMTVTQLRRYSELYSAFSEALLAPTKDVDRENPSPLAVTAAQYETIEAAGCNLFRFVLRLDVDGKEAPPEDAWIRENILAYPNIPDEVLDLQKNLNDGGILGNHLALLRRSVEEGGR